MDYFPLNIFHGTRSGIKNLPLPITEICLHICVGGIIIEEFRQVSVREGGVFFKVYWQFLFVYSYTEYLAEASNSIDLTAIFLYLIGFITRFIVMEGFFTFSK